MLLAAERRMIVTYGKKLLSSGLTTGTGGNLSLLNAGRGLVAISPSGIEYPELTPDDVVVIDLDGQPVDGRLKPSSEWGIHLALYKRRKEIRAVVHTHSVYATTMACLHWEIPPVHYLVGFSGKKVPLAPYAAFGSRELAENVADSIGAYRAVLMANHGLITVGADMNEAFSTAEEIEFVARIYYQTNAVGEPQILSDREMEEVIEKFATYGQKEIPAE